MTRDTFSHCTTCSCVPGMTPAIRYDTTPAEKEGAVRDHLIRMGWTPPAETQRCTCPSGDGSLRWPCPAHPPEAQPAAVDGDWRKKAAEWLESKAVEQEAANQKWPSHAACYKEWRDRPGILRHLAIQVLAAQQGGT